MIWKHPATPEGLAAFLAGTLPAHLGIEVTEVGDDFLRATMPVDARTRQPYGLLHGGASVALAETLGSLAGSLCIDLDRQHCVGVDINASHLRPAREGRVTGTVRPVRVGRRLHVWAIDVVDEAGRLVCVSRITLAVVDRDDE